MIGNVLVSLVWIANTAVENNGSMLHMAFYRTFQASTALALLSLGFEVLVTPVMQQKLTLEVLIRSHHYYPKSNISRSKCWRLVSDTYR